MSQQLLPVGRDSAGVRSGPSRSRPLGTVSCEGRWVPCPGATRRSRQELIPADELCTILTAPVPARWRGPWKPLGLLWRGLSLGHSTLAGTQKNPAVGQEVREVARVWRHQARSLRRWQEGVWAGAWWQSPGSQPARFVGTAAHENLRGSGQGCCCGRGGGGGVFAVCVLSTLEQACGYLAAGFPDCDPPRGPDCSRPLIVVCPWRAWAPRTCIAPAWVTEPPGKSLASLLL